MYRINAVRSFLLGAACALAIALTPHGHAQTAGTPALSQPPPLDLGGGVTLELVAIPAGEFTMGSPETERNREPAAIREKQHRRKIPAFQMGKFEVTQKQWLTVMGELDNRDPDENVPVTGICWHQAMIFCDKASQKTGRNVRLPWEAEWEYACRAGTTTAFCFAEDDAQLGEFAWFRGNFDPKVKLRPVGQKKPNSWGLHDMYGNVREWCRDCCKPYPESGVGVEGPTAFGEATMAVRGGCRSDPSHFCRSAQRGASNARTGGDELGFRVVVDDQPPPARPKVVPPTSERPLLLDLGGGATLELIAIPAGEFTMGSPDKEEGRFKEETPHQRKISRPFHIGVYEVTQKQWQAVMGGNPSSRKRDDLPVTDVSWDDAQAFCAKLSEKCRRTVRLPWEAEWEYACRAGATTAYCFGDSEADLRYFAWYDDNDQGWVHAVGMLRPNAWGLYDMHGNVAEWCQDWVAKYPAGGADEKGPSNDPGDRQRIARGARLVDDARHARSAARTASANQKEKSSSRGLRVVIDAEPFKAAAAGAAPNSAKTEPPAQPQLGAPAPKAAADGDRKPAGDTFPGVYKLATKIGANGEPRHGSATIEKKGAVYEVKLDYQGGVALQGVGVRAGGADELWAAYGPPRTVGLAIYEIKGGKLEGKWYPWYATDGDEKNLGTETLTGPENLTGDFKIAAAAAPKTGAAYTGTVKIVPTGIALSGDAQTYTLKWTMGTLSYAGVGIRVKDRLIVSSGSGEDFAALRLKVDAGALSGESFDSKDKKGAHTLSK